MLPTGILREHSKELSFVLRGLDVLAVVGAGLIAYFYRFGDLNLSQHYISAFSIAAVLTLFIFQFFHVYDSIRAKGFWCHFRSLVQAVCAIIVLLAGLAFITKSGDYFSRSWFMMWGGSALVLVGTFRCSVMIVLRLIRSTGWNERRVIILGAGELGSRLAETIQQSPWTGFHIVDIFDDEVQNINKVVATLSVKQAPKNISAYLATLPQAIDEVWLAFPFRAELRVKTILHELRHDTVTTRFVLDIFGLDLLTHSISDLAGFPVLNIRSTPMKGLNRVIKALEDRVFAGIILLLISPLLLFIAIAVKWSSPGPVFYRQKRISWNGKEFDMLKFRTMPVDAEVKTGPVWAKSGEARATKIGAILRKTSLDELPQFLNVLYGDMSIVGPRPERLVFVEEFKEKIPGYMQKHLVKAGITGWAQINGWRGNTSLEKRIEYDLYYIQNWSLIFDIKIIFLTIFQGFVNKNAY
jgi:putative colanic acid biosynthesis UDP-glucose lipid carrier transferase